MSPYLFIMIEKKKELLLSNRLCAVYSFIRDGAVLADIGTDHAFLPIYSVLNGKCCRAIAADINEMPLMHARKNIENYGISDKIECVLTSGFDGLYDRGITDGAVCGMGGELIADIISKNDFIKQNGFRLIVQPMTMHDITRKALLREGFEICGEISLTEEGKYYTVICADYVGQTSVYDEFQLLFGKSSLKEYVGDSVREDYIKHDIKKYDKIASGKRQAGISASFEEDIINKLKERL